MNVLLTMEAVSVIPHSMRTDVLLDVLILLVLITVPVMKDTHWQRMLVRVLVSMESILLHTSKASLYTLRQILMNVLMEYTTVTKTALILMEGSTAPVHLLDTLYTAMEHHA